MPAFLVDMGYRLYIASGDKLSIVVLQKKDCIQVDIKNKIENAQAINFCQPVGPTKLHHSLHEC